MNKKKIEHKNTFYVTLTMQCGKKESNRQNHLKFNRKSLQKKEFVTKDVIGNSVHVI